MRYTWTDEGLAIRREVLKMQADSYDGEIATPEEKLILEAASPNQLLQEGIRRGYIVEVQ